MSNQPSHYSMSVHLGMLDVVEMSFSPSIRMDKKGDLAEFECGVLLGAREALSISESVVLDDLFTDNHL